MDGRGVGPLPWLIPLQSTDPSYHSLPSLSLSWLPPPSFSLAMERLPPPAQHSLSTVSFSEDSTIMATGFTESYIRLWSLNGKGLRALRTDLTGDEVNKTTDGALPFSSSSPLVRFFLSRHDDKMRPD